MERVKVLIVDDSAFTREVIGAVLSQDREIEIVGEASNGKEAIEKISEFKPDIVTMDINMPVMDGLEAIEQIMAFSAVPILVVTSSQDADIAFKAISKGALEVMPKPEFDNFNNLGFTSKVKLLSKVKVISHIGGRHRRREPVESDYSPQEPLPSSSPIIAIAASTGGPRALSTLLSGLPASFPIPIVIAQHMSDDFISGLVKWLDEISRLTVVMPEGGEKLEPGVVYISPSEKHMRVSSRMRIVFSERQLTDIYFPSCNILLSSVAEFSGASSIGVILTGMGNDGVEGLKKIKKMGGYTLAQDEKSSVVFGMPKMAIEALCIDKVLPIDEISHEIMTIIKYKLSVNV